MSQSSEENQLTPAQTKVCEELVTEWGRDEIVRTFNQTLQFIACAEVPKDSPFNKEALCLDLVFLIKRFEQMD